MTHTYRPAGFTDITPYLTVENAAALIEFVVEVFNAELLHNEVDEDNQAVLNAILKIGDSLIEVSDATADWEAMPVALHIYVPDIDATYQKALQTGGISLYEPWDMTYGERSGGIQDPSGNKWYIATVLGEG